MPVPQRPPSGYLPIEAYAAIGNGQTVALVGSDGSIDWCCLPRFDSPLVLARLLDERNGGCFSLSVKNRAIAVRRSYRGETNVLQTLWQCSTGTARVSDFMALGESLIVRHVEVLAGTVDLTACFAAGPDTGRRTPSDNPTHLRFEGEYGGALKVKAPSDWRLAGAEGTWSSELRLMSGQKAIYSLAVASARTEDLDVAAAESLLHAALAHWARDSSRIRYSGPYRDAVVRSSLALGLHIYQPTGALVAAPTTSLPEEIGGVRNWDYRFTWLRDAALVLEALMRLGLHDQAMHFWRWLERLCIGCRHELRIMYTVDGTEVPFENQRTDLEGYRGSAPVRIGNDATAQRQLDIYGYVLDAAHYCQTHMRSPNLGLKLLLRHLADGAAAKWPQADQGIWEMRGPARHFLHSKLMCWVALDRAVKLSQRGWLDGDAAKWRRARRAVRQAILRKGYNATLASFTQVFDGCELDAAVLQLPLVGFLPGTDRRVQSTIVALQRALQRNGLLLRYADDDRLAGREGAFLICSFWLVQAMALAGRHRDARALFEQLLGYASDVGLLSEQIAPSTGAFLGNFPQAFSHLALIRAALTLDPQGS